ncbi:MAG: peroxiredoxin [bacterium]|nr:peroxiredoxin [bacterium]
MFSIDQKFPDFSLEVYVPEKDDVARFSSKDLLGKWAVFLFYPADFTFVCPTELADMNRLYSEFKKLEAEVVSVSTDTVYTHKAWLEVEALLRGVRYPMAADHNGKLSRELGIYDEENGMAQRAAFIIDPDGILRAADLVSDSIGRSAGEILRKLKALHFVRSHPGKVCPVSWEETGVVLTPSVKKAGKVYKEYAK